MPEEDPYAPQILRAAGDAIRAEAGKWDDLSVQMDAVGNATKPLWLPPIAFAVADPVAGAAVAIDEFDIYREVHNHLCALIDGAVAEFDQLGDALRKMATEYENSDERTYINMNEIYKAG